MSTGGFGEALEQLAEERLPAPPRRSRRSRLVVAITPPLAAFAVFVGIAYLVSYEILSAGRRFLMPPPHEIVKNGLFNGQHLHEQLSALWATTQVSLTGLALAFAMGGF